MRDDTLQADLFLISCIEIPLIHDLLFLPISTIVSRVS